MYYRTELEWYKQSQLIHTGPFPLLPVAVNASATPSVGAALGQGISVQPCQPQSAVCSQVLTLCLGDKHNLCYRNFFNHMDF